MVRKISGAFTGGAVGGFFDSLIIWLLGVSGISDLIGIGMKPQFKAPWLYERIVWGGLWMLLLIVPFLKGHVVLRGVLLSLFPSAMMLFYVLPSMGQGLLGMGFGSLMPAVVILLNFLYGTVASLWYAKVID